MFFKGILESAQKTRRMLPTVMHAPNWFLIGNIRNFFPEIMLSPLREFRNLPWKSAETQGLFSGDC